MYFILQKVITEKCWSMSEFGHAIILLVHFHSLCSFVFACNLNGETPRGAKVSGVNYSEMSTYYSGMFLCLCFKTNLITLVVI